MPFNNNQTTRFGADPLLDQELATKSYVDNSSSGGGWLVLQADTALVNTSVPVYHCFNGAEVPSTLEIWARAPSPNAFTWSRMIFYLTASSLNEDGTFISRIAGADGNQTVTIPASTSGIFQDLVNTDSVVTEDFINYKADFSAVTVGSGTFRAWGCECAL